MRRSWTIFAVLGLLAVSFGAACTQVDVAGPTQNCPAAGGTAAPGAGGTGGKGGDPSGAGGPGGGAPGGGGDATTNCTSGDVNVTASKARQ